MNLIKGFIICSLSFINFNQSKAQIFFKTHPGINPYQFETVKEKLFKHAAVTSAHPLASMVGAAILQDGGNAFDAMVATELSLAIAFPFAGNLGGGGFMVYRMADGSIGSIDYREKAPLAATRDMYLDENGEVIPRLSTTGALAVGVPGTIAGILEVHRKFGTLPLEEI